MSTDMDEAMSMFILEPPVNNTSDRWTAHTLETCVVGATFQRGNLIYTLDNMRRTEGGVWY